MVHSPIPPPRERALALLVLAASLLAVLWVVAVKPTLGVVGQHNYPYHPAPHQSALPALFLLGLPLVLAPAFLFRRVAQRPGQATALAGVLAAWTLLFRLGAAFAPKVYPGAELALPFLWPNTEGAYATEVPDARHAARYLATYADRLDVSTDPRSPRYVRIHHTQVHPPGIVLALSALDGLYDAVPGLARAVDGTIERHLASTLIFRDAPPGSLRYPLPVAVTAALLLMVLASLAPLVAFFAARRVLPAEATLGAAALTALLPGTYLFSPSLDQAYPTLTLLLVWLTVGVVTTRRARWGVALGVAFYGALFIHVAYGLVGGILALAAVLAWRAERPEWGLRELRIAYWRPLAAAAVGFLLPAVLLGLAFGYPTFGVILLCLRNNVAFNAQVGRTWWPWVAVVPFEFALSFGFALLLLVAGAWLREAAGIVRTRALRGSAATLLAVGGVLLPLHLMGMNRGETARLWLLLTPLLVVSGVDALWRRAVQPRRFLTLVVAAQLVQLVFFLVFLDLGRTANFLLKDLPASVGK